MNMGFIAPKVFLVAFLAVASANHQKYPGTSKRPILSADEAAKLSEKAYLQGWTVGQIKVPSKPDYIVGHGEQYGDIQGAVDAAIRAGGSKRKYIKIKAGTYKQSVFITGNVPITLYGEGRSNTKIVLDQPASMSVSRWKSQVNPSGKRYKEGDPAYSLYSQCAKRTDTIGTTCTSVMWITSNNLQLLDLHVENANKQPGNAQAVAVKVDADKVHISDVTMISRQDTFFSGAGRAGERQRVYVENTEIRGDVDFVFGGASTVFNKCVFRALSDRHPVGVVFAPNTDPNDKYGFLVINSVITSDAKFKSTKQVSLARSWESFPYVPGKSANGQLFIYKSSIDNMINDDAPYTTSTASRTYKGNASTKRNLNDNKYNRFWEYGNFGGGS